MLLVHEGGWVDHPKDPGGATMSGITLDTFRDFYKNPKLTKEDLRNISAHQIQEIYLANYWDKCRCSDLPSGIDYVVFDAAVNSGATRAIKWLQTAVGATQDGIMGTGTLQQTKECDISNPGLVADICTIRLRFMQKLSTWEVFGKGWSLRVLEVCKNSFLLRGVHG